MGEAELRVNQSRQTALDEGTPSPEQEGEKICRQGLDNNGNIEALPSGWPPVSGVRTMGSQPGRPLAVLVGSASAIIPRNEKGGLSL